jgi:hypothetical protein
MARIGLDQDTLAAIFLPGMIVAGVTATMYFRTAETAESANPPDIMLEECTAHIGALLHLDKAELIGFHEVRLIFPISELRVDGDDDVVVLFVPLEQQRELAHAWTECRSAE